MPWAAAHQAPLSMVFPRQEYLSGLQFPSPRDLPDPGIKRMFPALTGRFFTTEPPGMPSTRICVCAKSLQSCPALCDSMDYSPPGSSVHGDSPGKDTVVGCHALLQG